MKPTTSKVEPFRNRYSMTLGLGRISLVFLGLAILATVVRGMRALRGDFPFFGPSLVRMWLGVLFGLLLLPNMGLGIDLAFRPLRTAWRPACVLLLASLIALWGLVGGGIHQRQVRAIAVCVALSFGLGFVWYVGTSLSILVGRRVERRLD